jgi:hypothetical protein
MNKIGASVFFLACAAAISCPAQQVSTNTSNSSIGDGFAESMSLNWSLAGPNWFANFNNQVAPSFGPNLSNSGASGGFQFVGDGFSGNLNFNFAQGSSRSNIGSAQSVTTMNGVPGSFFSGQVRPFVTGVAPVVGGSPANSSPLGGMAAADQQSKLSAIADGNAKSRNQKLQNYLTRAERAESEGNFKMARANYRLALGLADEPLRSMIQTTLREKFSGSAVKSEKR